MRKFTKTFQPRNLIKQFYSSKVDLKCLYTKDHEWVRTEGKIATIGITDHAQEALGEITNVSYRAKVGNYIEEHQSVGDVESVKTVSEIFSPVKGKVLKVNKNLEEK
jgi:glycine cleavage system H protein